MAVKIGINGFGRVGRACIRIAAENPEKFDLRAINLRNSDIPHMVYMLKYDTVFGRFPGTIEAAEDGIVINGKFIKVFGESDISKIDWASVGAEYIAESTGAFTKSETASGHFAGGAKKVVITAPAKDATPTFVLGVNHEEYKSEYTVISNASCTTNCLAPLAKVLQDEFGIAEGLLTTIHAATSKQKAVDSRAGSDWRISRSMYGNIIPSTTGAAKACALVIPALKGKMTGMAFRVPTADASVVDFTVRLEKETTYEEICAAVKKASETTLKGVLEYTADPIVSSDVIGNSHPCVFDEKAGIQLSPTFFKLIAWYDNEWGYACQTCEMLHYIATVDGNA